MMKALFRFLLRRPWDRLPRTQRSPHPRPLPPDGRGRTFASLAVNPTVSSIALAAVFGFITSCERPDASSQTGRTPSDPSGRAKPDATGPTEIVTKSG